MRVCLEELARPELKTIDDILREELRQRKLPFIVERAFQTGVRAYRSGTWTMKRRTKDGG